MNEGYALECNWSFCRRDARLTEHKGLCDSQSSVSAWLTWELPRRLGKSTSGLVCQGASRSGEWGLWPRESINPSMNSHCCYYWHWVKGMSGTYLKKVRHSGQSLGGLILPSVPPFLPLLPYHTLLTIIDWHLWNFKPKQDFLSYGISTRNLF